MVNIPFIRIGHLKIVDHLILGVSTSLLNQQKFHLSGSSLSLQSMTSWNQVTDALVENEIDGAFIPAPLAMHLFSQGVGIRIIMFAHRAGSVIVKNTDKQIKSFSDFKGYTILVPSEFAIQTMLLHKMLSSVGLNFGKFNDSTSDVVYEVAPPLLMTEMLSINGDSDLAGIAVPEPYASKAIQMGLANKICNTSDVWKNHPCCVFVLKEKLLGQHPETVNEIIKLFLQAAELLSSNLDGPVMEAANKFLDINIKDLRNVINFSGISFSPDLLKPDIASLELIQNYMVEAMNVLEKIDLSTLVDDTVFLNNLQGNPS